MLEQYIREQREKKDILLMTHIVLGYPCLEDSLALARTMVKAGVDVMELQIPFSEPIADGPVILKANQEALAGGVKVADCLACAAAIAKELPIPFLYMTYYNIPYAYGLDRFAAQAAAAGLRGAIVPDVPPEEAEEYLQAMEKHCLEPIFIFTPNSKVDRMRTVADCTRGFVYCVARKGVTGETTAFSQELEEYLARCRQATDLPLALGFGVKDKKDVDFLKGRVDMAVVGSQAIRVLEEQGVDAVGEYIAGLR